MSKVLRGHQSQRKRTRLLVALPLLAVLFASAPLEAREYPLPPEDVDLIGCLREALVEEGDTLLDVARRHNIGQEEILLANPRIDRWLPDIATTVLIPSRYILPRAARRGIVINVPEMRLYYYPPDYLGRHTMVVTHPISVGRMDWTTPLGETRIIAKVKDPSWRPPESIRREAAEQGELLPKVVPPGPDNPLGRYALRLAVPGYLIHSTNKPYGVGMRVTHGCVRMYPEDIEPLFQEIPLDTPVQIVDQPIKLGWLADTLYIEVHPPLEEAEVDDEALLRLALDQLQIEHNLRPLQLKGGALRKALREKNGIPTPIGEALSVGE
ncbi:MAG: L,D-transpeptidase family protein [Gammaproteobacteria bacterium]